MRNFFQTAVSLAYGLGPLIGGYLVEIVGFPNIMRTVGVLNILYVPLLFLLKVQEDDSINDPDPFSEVYLSSHIFQEILNSILGKGGRTQLGRRGFVAG